MSRDRRTAAGVRVCKQTSTTDPGTIPASLSTRSAVPRSNGNIIRPRLQRHSTQPTRQLRLGSLNIQSVNKKVDTVLDLIKNCHLDILTLCETWHEDPDTVCIRRLRSDGFTVLECARQIDPKTNRNRIGYVNHGGVAIMARPGVRLAKLQPAAVFTKFECICSRVSVTGGSYVIAAIYRPGSRAICSTFYKEFSLLLEFLASFQSPVLITGDINFHLERLHDADTIRLQDTLSSFGLVQHVNQPTHNKGGTLDVIITRSTDDTSTVDTRETGASDHLLLMTDINLQSPSVCYTTIQSRSWRQLDTDKFKADLLQSLSIDQSESVDDMISTFDNTVKILLDRHVPVKTVTRRKRASDAWYDEQCRQQKRCVRKHERRYKRTRNDNDRATWLAALRSMHKLNDVKRSQFWCGHIESQRGKPREMWRSVNRLLGRQPSPTSGVGVIDADTMASFFRNKVDEIRVSTADADEPTYTINSSDCSFMGFEPVNVQAVIKLIRDAPPKTSPIDPLPMWLLKVCADEVAPFISKLFNQSLCVGVVPTAFKTAIVTPLLKKTGLNDSDPSNYRPISNLATLGKLLERVVAQQITSYLCQNNLFPEFQSAYRQYRSTETALIKVVNDIIRALDDGDLALLTLLDLSSAFDTVDHEILLNRLEISFGIQSLPLKWMRSYLTSRSQAVSFGGRKSMSETVHCGVPQGSVLGPLLFILYTADVEKLIRSLDLSVHLYADDTQQYCSAKAAESDSLKQRTVHVVNQVALWMASNRLRLNAAKTECMWCATARRQHLVDHTPIDLNGVAITPSTSVRDLGVLLSSDMSMNSHVNKVVSECFYKLRQLKTCRRCLPTPVAASLINCFVISKVDYCNALLAGQPDYIICRLQSVLNAAARLIFGLRKLDHITETLRDRLHWLRIRERVDFKLCLLVYKAQHGLAPDYIAAMCRPVSSVEARRRLRSAAAGDLLVPSSCTEFGRRAFSIAAVETWNTLPVGVRTSPSVNSFKAALKTCLFRRSYN